MKFSGETNALFEALAKAQGSFKAIPMDKVNPHFKNKYASLTATQEGTRDGLSKNGLALTQSIDIENDVYYLETVLSHSSGQWMSSRLKLLLDRQNMQGLGSATTYAKRYAWQAILGVVGDEDDDGNLAVGNVNVPQSTEPQKKLAPPNHAPQFQDPGKFVCNIGRKYKGKRIEEIDKNELGSYIEWLEGQGKPLDGVAFEFVKHAKDFLSKF